MSIFQRQGVPCWEIALQQSGSLREHSQQLALLALRQQCLTLIESLLQLHFELESPHSRRQRSEPVEIKTQPRTDAEPALASNILRDVLFLMLSMG